MPSVTEGLPEAYEGNEPYIFVSYKHEDGPQVYPLVRELNDQGYRVWYDEGIPPSKDYRKEIANALIRCDLFLVCMTAQAIDSEWVMNEINMACDERKPFLAIHLEECRLPPELRLQIGRFQAIWKWKLSAADYRRALGRALPATSRRTKASEADASASEAVRAQVPPTKPASPAPSAAKPQKSLVKAQRLAEKRRISDEKRLAEEKRFAKEKRAARARRAAEAKRIADAERILAVRQCLAEEQRIAEGKRLAEEKRRVEEQRIAEGKRLAEEKRRVEEQRISDEKRRVELRRLVEEQRVAEEKWRTEAKRLAEKRPKDGAPKPDPLDIQIQEAKKAVVLTKAEEARIRGEILSLKLELSDIGKELCALRANRKGAADPIPDIRLDVDNEKRMADEKRQREYLTAVAAPEAAIKKQDYAPAGRETKAALGLRPDGAEALDLSKRLQPKLEVRSEVDGRDTPGAVIAFSGKPTAHKTPITFQFEQGKTYEVSVSLPSEGGRGCAPAKQTFVADWHGPRVWKARLETRQAVQLSAALLEPKPPKSAARRAGDADVVDLGGGIKIEMVWCPPGSFLIGSPENEENRKSNETQHRVTLTKGFWMGKFEVTQAQWEAVTGSNPSWFKGADLPVEQVSWDDCQAFVAKLNAKAPGGGFRLPTEAEWEYACRAGTTEAYAGNLDEMAWYGSNSGSTSHPVGQKKPNAWGLYDMHGNVCEWCQDWYGDYPTGSVTEPVLVRGRTPRVIRGGDLFYNARGCRSAYRYGRDPRQRCNAVGLRLARNPQDP